MRSSNFFSHLTTLNRGYRVTFPTKDTPMGTLPSPLLVFHRNLCSNLAGHTPSSSCQLTGQVHNSPTTVWDLSIMTTLGSQGVCCTEMFAIPKSMGRLGSWFNHWIAKGLGSLNWGVRYTGSRYTIVHVVEWSPLTKKPPRNWRVTTSLLQRHSSGYHPLPQLPHCYYYLTQTIVSNSCLELWY